MGENSQDNTQYGAPAGGLQKKTKIAYGVGAVGKDMVYMLVASYILYYYNSVLGVSSVFIGTVLMAARVFDAFNDPIMGIVVAKTRSRWGRFRPWIFSGTVLNAVVLYAMFAVPESMGAGGMKVFLTVTYFLWGITYTLMDIPYWSMIPAVTRTPADRENLSVVGRTCAGVGSALIAMFTMLLVVTSNNLIVMWAAIEATTLSSAFLVGIYGQRSSLEAAWKYIIICTVGVAFGLFGTVLVYANVASVMPQAEMAIFWSEVLKQSSLLDPTLMLLAFVFVLIGFGTKTGLFPMHAWLPDAHSEAPSPVSALLSAVLLNCALLVLIRYYIIICQAIGSDFPNRLLLIFGMLSVAVAAFFILVQRDIKRLLAYSSVENMGLVAVALGIGGPLGIFAALLHTLNHSLAKTLLFCGSGNVLLKYGTRDLNVVCGMLKIMPFTAVLFGGGALALAGMPPFNIFLSEFMTVTAGLARNHLLIIVLLLLLLTLVLAGLVRMAARVLMAKPPQAVNRGDLGWLTTSPMVILLVMMLAMGTHIPQPVIRILAGASTIVLSGTHDLPAQRSTWHDFLPSGTASVSEKHSER